MVNLKNDLILVESRVVTFVINDVESTNKKKDSRCKNENNRNNEHDHRVNKQNGDIKMITDKKQYDRIPIKWNKKCLKIIRNCKQALQNTN